MVCSAHDCVLSVHACMHAQASELHAQLHQRLTSTLRTALKKAQGKQRAFQQQLGAADGADEVQMQADMITANIWRWAALLNGASWDQGGRGNTQSSIVE